MLRNKTYIISLIVLFILAIGGYFIFPTFQEKIQAFVKSASSNKLAQEIKQELFTTPLRGNDAPGQARLTRSGVIERSNIERTKENLDPLQANALLTAAAEAKLKDMFDKQYFEHISPEGNGPGYLAEQAHYSYIIVGENLALGNFKDDQALVDAWMASPGHRANIMHTRFKEIGVAVGEGMFNGKKVWLAVQEFGSPSSDCPAISAHLKGSIDQDKALINSLNTEIETMRAEIKAMPRTTREEQEAYNKKIDEYNALVARYDTIFTRLQANIETYNADVRAYNTCIKG